jgi:uncharacterized membrane protein (DUF485 family)
MSANTQDRQNIRDLLCAVLVIVVYFAYMLTIAFAPQLLAAPVASGSPVSIGLAGGVAMAVFMVVFSAWYTHRRNKREPDGGAPRKQS